MNDRVARYVELIERPDTLDVLCQRVADGEGLPKLCQSWDVPYGRVLTWLMADAARYAVYLRALEVAAHRLVSEAVVIADTPPPVLEGGGVDTGFVADKKVRIDTRLKVAKQHARELYGDTRRVQVEVLGDFGERLRRARERVIEPPREALAEVVVQAVGSQAVDETVL